ncbi:hypothetical protein HAP93_10890 [Acidithiobacillus ferriphilus]|uniref:hypothetical protein n=1 Tax=Acidithiobacillus ferriphilus TaxID=1689834 RepID=UPI001C06053B|nr:hypothetical protein [Acidithiobacillus ferriphilus]MBU2786260.1 hypothetical protein [Acidithiobacillus ferriphilus]MBU2816634.1 hypothetical protein [Acidithiobacillus ferrooxidans]
MCQEINAGDVVKVPFPTDAGPLPHFALVIKLETFISGSPIVTVAYGSSKKVSVSGHLPHEFVLERPEDLEAAGLKVPTRFDLLRRERLTVEQCAYKGRLRLEDPGTKGRLMNALRAAYGL